MFSCFQNELIGRVSQHKVESWSGLPGVGSTCFGLHSAGSAPSLCPCDYATSSGATQQPGAGLCLMVHRYGSLFISAFLCTSGFSLQVCLGRRWGLDLGCCIFHLKMIKQNQGIVFSVTLDFLLVELFLYCQWLIHKQWMNNEDYLLVE